MLSALASIDLLGAALLLFAVLNDRNLLGAYGNSKV